MGPLMNQPWYIYVILVAMAVGYIYKHFKQGASVADLEDAKFKKSTENALSGNQLFSIALDTVLSQWWDVPYNTLTFKKVIGFNDYMEGWGINTSEGYRDMAAYFIKDGRRWYFDFISDMIKNKPETEWADLIFDKFGDNERAQRYFKLLKTNETLNTLKENGFISFDSEIEKGVAAYDAAILVGQARRAFTANLIDEKEAWEVISFATQLAKDNFSSWEEFSKSYILGFSLDTPLKHKAYITEVYHQYKQVIANPISPWNTIDWPNS